MTPRALTNIMARSVRSRQRFSVLVVALIGLFLVSACGGATGIPIYFQSDRDGQWEIYSIWHDGTNTTRLTSDPADDTDPRVSNDGTKLAFLRASGSSVDIWTMAVDGTAQTNVTDGGTAGPIHSVSWFPNGTRLVFTMTDPAVSDGRSQVYTINADGTGLAMVPANDQMIYRNAVVHPGGGTIAVAGGPSLESLDIHILATSSGKLERTLPNESFRAGAGQLTFRAAGVYEDRPSFDAGGRTLVFETNVTGNADIFQVESDGRNTFNRTAGSTANDSRPSRSGALDGFWFAFTSDRDGNDEIYIQNLGDNETVRITNNAARDLNPTWLKIPPTK